MLDDKFLYSKVYPEKDSINIVVSGDFFPYYESNRSDTNLLFDGIKSEIEKADICITNLEAPLTNVNSKIKKIGPNLKSPPESIELLKKSGINVACLANNHIMDYGVNGLASTVKACKNNNIETVGAGYNVNEASKLLFINNRDNTIAICNYSDKDFSSATKNGAGTNPFDLVNICNDIVAAKKRTPIVIVILHVGNMGYNLPTPDLAKQLRFIATYSPSAIICHHSHMISGYEIYANKVPIFYSLGNFFFPKKDKTNKNWFIGLMIKLSINSDGKLHSYNLIPFEQNYHKDGIKLLSDREFQAFEKRINCLSEIINDTNQLQSHFDNYVDKVGKEKLAFLITPNKFLRILFVKKIVTLPFKLIHNFYSIFHMIFNEAHREVLIHYIRKFYINNDS